MTRSIGLTALLALVVGLGACVPRVQQPEITLGGARLASVGFTGGVVDVRLSVHNPNRFAVEARGLTYDLEVRDAQRDRWVPFTEGRIDDTIRVDGRDTRELTVPVEFTFRGLNEALRSLLDQGAFEYRISGVVELSGPVRRDLRYQHAGRYEPAGAG